MDSEIALALPLDIVLPERGERLEGVWIEPAAPSAPTLIFLHEGLGCVALWRDFPARLAAATGCGVLIYSRLGYGRSDPCALPRPIDFMHHEGLSVLPAVIRQTGIGEHILVGHSDGGSIALIHAGWVATPGLKGVVTLAAHVFCEALTCESIADARVRYLEGDLKARLAAYHGDNTDCAFWGWNDVWLHPDFRHWNIEAFLPGIGVPVLAIQGEKDPYGTRAQVDSIRQKTGSAVQVAMIPDCGHAPHLEKKDAVLATVGEFVRSLF
ncbi:alpha/beta fold hydrolase [Desulfosarcina ovata]|uniref:Hydrolase n=1 Tax=Desulfosarcina ovata subsp. ovata TaxID=2752305 RepID=A0A5K8AF46_9BACT|nr:alpha/beta hydrolase [Desulfosarcina ovata]BBO91265.1 hydrolase [Desulfosarcina ovata subsp. ovata]